MRRDGIRVRRVTCRHRLRVLEIRPKLRRVLLRDRAQLHDLLPGRPILRLRFDFRLRHRVGQAPRVGRLRLARRQLALGRLHLGHQALRAILPRRNLIIQLVDPRHVDGVLTTRANATQRRPRRPTRAPQRGHALHLPLQVLHLLHQSRHVRVRNRIWRHPRAHPQTARPGTRQGARARPPADGTRQRPLRRPAPRGALRLLPIHLVLKTRHGIVLLFEVLRKLVHLIREPGDLGRLGRQLFAQTRVFLGELFHVHRRPRQLIAQPIELYALLGQLRGQLVDGTGVHVE